MEFRLEYNPEDFIIQITVIGEFNNQDLNKTTAALIKAQQKYGSHRILLDHRQAIPELSTVEIFQRPKIAKSLGLSILSKIAVIYGVQEEDYRFFETTSFNQGFNMKLFTEINTAKRWLIETPTGPTKV